MAEVKDAQPGREPRRRPGPFLSLEEFITTVRALGITSSTEYATRYREHPTLPANPNQYYETWPGWRAVLQKWEQPDRLLPRDILPFEEAQQLVRAAGWLTSREYYAHRRDHPGLPLRPDRHYDEWPGWTAFLGKPSRSSGRPHAGRARQSSQ